MTDTEDNDGTKLDIVSAVVQGEIDRYESLVETADLEHRSGTGRTLLHKAASMGRRAIVEDLIDRGVDVDAQDDGGKTPLHLAVQKGHETIVVALLESGANPSIGDMYGARPLQKAVSNDDYQLAERLLEHGADPTHENEADISPLHIARRADADRYIELLESYVDGEDA